MMKAVAVLTVCVVAAVPAWAGDATSPRPRLVTGSITPGLASPESRSELFATGGFSVGTLSGPSSTPDQPLAVGGYAAYSFDALRLSSSLKGDRLGSGADLTAAYSGAVLGIDGVTALTLGYEWARPLAFSPNPVQGGLAGTDILRPMGDLSLSLSFTHDIGASLSVGGFAAATRTEEDDSATAGFRLGAGFGVRF